MIPKIIHQIWFQGYDKLPKHLHDFHKSWKEMHPDYQIIVWDEISISQVVSTMNDDIIDMYHSYKKMIQKIDLAKYIILYNYGGIYIDMDVKSLKSLDILLDKNEFECIFSKMPYHYIQKVLFSIIGISPFTTIINNGIIMVKPKHDIMLYTIIEAFQNKDHYIKNVNNMLYIFASTGPLCLTNAIEKYKIQKPNSNIQILDKEIFEACDMDSVKHGCVPPPYAIGLHVYEGSWVSDSEKVITELYLWIYRNFALMLFIILSIYYIYKNKKVK